MSCVVPGSEYSKRCFESFSPTLQPSKYPNAPPSAQHTCLPNKNANAPPSGLADTSYFSARELHYSSSCIVYSSRLQNRCDELRLPPIYHTGETRTAHAAHIAHPGQICADEPSFIVEALKTSADEVRPIPQAGKTSVARVACTVHR